MPAIFQKKAEADQAWPTVDAPMPQSVLMYSPDITLPFTTPWDQASETQKEKVMNDQIIRKEQKDAENSILLMKTAQYHGKVTHEQVLLPSTTVDHLKAQISGSPGEEPGYVAQLPLQDFVPVGRRLMMCEYAVRRVTALIALKKSGRRLLPLEPLKIGENLPADPQDVPEDFYGLVKETLAVICDEMEKPGATDDPSTLHGKSSWMTLLEGELRLGGKYPANYSPTIVAEILNTDPEQLPNAEEGPALVAEPQGVPFGTRNDAPEAGGGIYRTLR